MARDRLFQTAPGPTCIAPAFVIEIGRFTRDGARELIFGAGLVAHGKLLPAEDIGGRLTGAFKSILPAPVNTQHGPTMWPAT